MERITAVFNSISIDDIPYQRAYDSKRNVSFDPQKRAHSIQASYLEGMQNQFNEWLKLSKTDEQKEILLTEFPRYKENYCKKYLACLDADSRCLSSMITGPANFPVARNEKRNETARKRGNELSEWDEKICNIIERKICPPENPAISSDDPEAIEKISARILKLKEEHERGKKANRVLKSKTDFNEKGPELLKLGYTQEVVNQILISFDRYGYCASSTNLYQNIKRLESRLIGLQRAKEATTQELVVKGIKVIYNTEANRLQFIFEGKPSDQVRTELKRSGFRWSGRYGAWQRQLTNNAKFAAKYFLKEYTEA